MQGFALSLGGPISDMRVRLCTNLPARFSTDTSARSCSLLAVQLRGKTRGLKLCLLRPVIMSPVFDYEAMISPLLRWLGSLCHYTTGLVEKPGKRMHFDALLEQGLQRSH